MTVMTAIKGRVALTEKFLTVEQVAKRLRVSRSTITRWIGEGFFPGARQKNPRLKTSPFEIPLTAVEQFEAMDNNDNG